MGNTGTENNYVLDQVVWTEYEDDAGEGALR